MNKNTIALAKITDIQMGQSPPGDTYNNQKIGAPLLNGPTEFGMHHPSPVLWTKSPTKICQPHDLLFCVRGSTTGRMNWADQEYCIGRGIAALRGKSGESDTRFVYYTLANELPNLLSRCAGSVFPNLSRGDLETFEIWWPDGYTRSSIAASLGAFDDKIELNRRMNETLEAMARALFKSWFMDFDPVRAKADEWRRGTLSEVAEIIMGQSPPGETYNESGEGMPFYQGIRDFGYRFPSRRVYCVAPTRFAEKGDALLSVRAPVGSLNIAIERCAIGRGIAALRLNAEHSGFLYYLLQATQSGWEKFEAEGTVFGSVSRKDIDNFEVIVPSLDSINSFGVLVEPIDARIKLNEQEMNTLAATRDALLPKLMSGEVRVRNADDFVEMLK